MMGSGTTPGIDRTKLRLAVLGALVLTAFVILFSRLWFLQVLASDEFQLLAKENRVRRVYSEPPRGRILDRNGVVLVDNRKSLAVTVDRELLDRPRRASRVLKRLSELLDTPVSEFRARLKDVTVSPYKPIAIANDVPERAVYVINDNQEDFPRVDVERLPVRVYPQGQIAAHVLGYVGEISREQLESEDFKDVTPSYVAGDIVGKSGVEYSYDRYLRGSPAINKVIVNSADDVIDRALIQEEQSGRDLHLSLDVRIQRLTERSLASGIAAARGRYFAPAGAVVVMDTTTGGVVAMASYPTYDPAILADGITTKEFNALGHATTDDPDDDVLLNRALQAQRQPGSTFKVVTAGAAMATGVADAYTQLECPGSKIYPPEGGPGSVEFNNWTSFNFGYLSFPESLEVSCNTFYYELGWRMEDAYGASEGDQTERFQKYARTAGFDHETGIDLPNEAEGRVPDDAWCEANEGIGYCPEGWYPGYTINMAIGQGDLIVTPTQMAVTYAAIANGGQVVRPRIGWKLARADELGGEERVVREFEPAVAETLPLDDAELDAIQDGLASVVSGVNGTATGAFAGFPTGEYPIAGKTGTAELAETELNDAWFISYGPTDVPQYVIAVYVEKAGHGGESAAPIAREVWEGIFELDTETDVQLGQDASG
jgi:penicillin-binding protein 2